MSNRHWLRLRASAAASPSAGPRRDRGRRRRSAALGPGLPRPEALEGRILLASLPVVTTQAATGVTGSTATLNGGVNPDGNSTDAAFEYSTDPGLAPNVVTTLAGTARQSGSADGTGAAALFNNPQGVALDPTTGDLYVGDTGNDTIRMITPAGVVTTFAGTAGQSGSTDGTGSAARFNGPEGVALDPTSGNIYVADTGNDTIRMITPAGVVTTLAGTAGQSGSTDGTGSAARFDAPSGVTVDPTTGNVYVADTGNDTIRMITSAGVVTTLAGTAGQSGSADGTGSAARFDAPSGLAVDSTTGNIYVADTSNNAVRMVTTAGVVTTLDSEASGDETLYGPEGVAVDPATGDAYVADKYQTIHRITTAGVDTTLAGVLDTSGSADGTGSAALFNDPVGVALNPATGVLDVADSGNDTIRQVSPPMVAAQTGLTGTTAQAVDAQVTGLQPGTTYYFRAIGTSTAGAAGGDILSFTTATLPTATTQAATSVADSTATLNAVINPQGVATTAQFIYGTDSSLATNTTTVPIPALTIGSGTTDVPVIEPVTGLQPGTTYYFRVAATGPGGTVDGDILSFTTAAQVVTRPILTVEQATDVTTGGATLNGTVNPNGVATTAYFLYGTQPTLASDTTSTAQQSIGDGTAAVAVSAALTGLQPGTTYYFEPVAISGGVTTIGPIQSFTTSSATAGPLVTNLQRYGYHTQPTEFVLTFDQALNPTTAQDAKNYRIVAVNGGQSGSPIPIASAVYDPTNHTVTLTTVDRVYLYGEYRITVNGTSPSGLSNTSGQFLQGQGSGHPGTDYVQTFGEGILAGPNTSAIRSRAARARILKAWPHERAFAARIAMRDAATARAGTAGDSTRLGPSAAAVDAVIGDIAVSGKERRHAP